MTVHQNISDMGRTRLAVLMTCHNRKHHTLACLSALKAQTQCSDLKLDTYLVDDGSRDGTGAGVRERYPDVHVIPGNGSLFWNGGMRLAWREARKKPYDFVLWLNDDTHLYPTTLRNMLDTYAEVRAKRNKDIVIAGSTLDPHSSVHTYGGLARPSCFNPMNFVLLPPASKPRECYTIHGNCVLIPYRIARAVGGLSTTFTHGLGDYDYGLRVRKEGFECWLAPGYAGTCAAHKVVGSQYDRSLSIARRIQKMQRPTGLPPPREWMAFTFRHAGFMWPAYWLRTLVRVTCPRLWLFVRRKASDQAYV